MHARLVRFVANMRRKTLLSMFEARDEGTCAAVRLEVLARKIAKRVVQLMVAKTFDRWAENAAEKKEQRRMIGSILKRWQRLKLSAMLEKCIVMTAGRILGRKVMNNIIKRYVLVAQSRAFISWRSFVDKDRTADSEKARLEVIVGKIAKRIVQLMVAKTFDR